MSAIVVGLTFGIGLCLIASGLIGARPSLAVVLARLDQPRASTPTPSEPTGGMLVRVIGVPLAATPVAARIARRFRSELRITGTSPEQHFSSSATDAILGLVGSMMVMLVLAAGGIHLDPTMAVSISVAVGIAGATLPVATLRGRAKTRRAGFRHALSCFLDLVAIRLAGGTGVEAALAESAQAGTGWAFTELGHALRAARLAGLPPWDSLAHLGGELDVSELSELAASMTIAGNEGARVRVSLAAKARAMRHRALTDAEGNAHAASERMSLPIVILMAGFVVFLGYPAITRVLTGI